MNAIIAALIATSVAASLALVPSGAQGKVANALLASSGPLAATDLATGAHAISKAGGLTLENSAISAHWTLSAEGLSFVSVANRLGASQVRPASDAFVVTLDDGTILRSSALKPVGEAQVSPLSPDPAASQGAQHFRGWRVAATLADEAHHLLIHWSADIREGGAYVRQEVRLEATTADVPIANVRLIDVTAANLRLTGVVKGSPVVAGEMFLALEHPASENHVAGARATGVIYRELPLRAGQSVTYSAVIGTTPPGQLRRGFLAYLERERAHPYRTFLHYNSWYDIGYFTKYDETDALASIKGVGEALAARRGVKLDSFMFDDGWDDRQGQWNFHSGFPQGFTSLKTAAAQYGASPGIWLSPWGGYGKPKKERIAAGQALGLETNAGGFVLSGPKYYSVFETATLDLLKTAGINQFKIDGAGNADSVFPGAAFDSDFQAAISLIDQWRKVRPDLFINLSTGTYPSPFWLKFSDTIWRGGEDHNFLGVGSWRQRWITYRDADTYAGVVASGSLYPLNSLMLHGIIYAAHARHLDTDPQGDFADEARSYFAAGTQLQELYISHGLLKPADWDVLAQAAKWSRANADVLVDTHWIGGDPALLEVYGWASWSPRKGVITVRNPSDKAQDFNLAPASALELPKAAHAHMRLHNVWSSAPDHMVDARKPLRLHLKPFEVLTLEATPR